MAVNMNNRKRYEVWVRDRCMSAHRYEWIARLSASLRGGWVRHVR